MTRRPRALHRGNEPDRAKRQAAKALYDSGLSLELCGQMLGVSKQAVHQLLKRDNHPRRRAGGNTGSHSRHRA